MQHPRRTLAAALAAAGLAALAAATGLAQERVPATLALGDPPPSGAGAPSSPFTAPGSTALLFVTDQAPGLDTQCQFAFEGPLTFDLLVDRYVGPVNPDGTLVDPVGLAAAGVLGGSATLILPSFDVDADAVVPPPFQPEIDRVLFNGVEVGFLGGAGNQWKLNSLAVPIGLVRFADRAPLGQPTVPATNTVTVEIDVGNDPALELWCTSLDWGALAVTAASPVALLHDEGSDPGFWDRHGFRPALEASGFAVDALTLTAQDLEPQGLALRQLLADVARRHGADRVHAVAHGKGGLDARAWLAAFGHEAAPGLASLSTVAAPHEGSAAADVLWSRARLAEAGAGAFGAFPSFPGTLAPLVALSPGVGAETSGAAAAFAARTLATLAGGPPLHAVAADADRDASGAIDQPGEYAGLLLDDANLAAAPAALAQRSVDHAHGVVAGAPAARLRLRLEPVAGDLGTRVVPTLLAAPAAGPRPNDAQVATDSALGASALGALLAQSAGLVGGAGRDHSNAADGATAALLAAWLRAADQQGGDL